MPTIDTGLARIQTQSRIPVTQWKEWCDRLGLEIADVAELWDGVCFPMMVASRSIPDVAYILQMRAARKDVDDLEEFKEELASILHINALLGSLQDDSITGGKYRATVLQLYRYACPLSPETTVSPRQRIRHAVVELCAAALLTKVVPGENVSFSRLTRLLVEERTSRQALCSMVMQGEPPEDVADCLQALDDYDSQHDQRNSEEDIESAMDQASDTEEEAEEDKVEEEDEVKDEVELFVDRFRLAIASIYDRQEGVGEGAQSVEARERAIAQFDPLNARIPSVEEAKQLATAAGKDGEPSRRRQRSNSRPANPLRAKPSTNKASARSSTSTVSGGAASPVRASATPAGGRQSKPSAAYVGGTQTTADATEESDGLPPLPESPHDVVQPKQVAAADLGECVFKIGQLLSALESHDQRVWMAFHSPEADIEEPANLSEALVKTVGGACDAYRSIRFVAQHQHLKALLQLPPDKRLKQRRFELEATAFINTVSSARRVFEADSRQLIPRPRVLDHAAACLVRIEALRTAVLMVREDPQAFSAAAATQRYESVLSNITHLADSTLMGNAREMADEDIATLSAAVAVKHLVEILITGSRQYLRALKEEEQLNDVDSLRQATESTPLTFDGLEPATDAPPFLRNACRQAAWAISSIRFASTSSGRSGLLLIPYTRARMYRTGGADDPQGAVRVRPLRSAQSATPPQPAGCPFRHRPRHVDRESGAGPPVRPPEHGEQAAPDRGLRGWQLCRPFELRKNEKRQMHARAKERAAQEDTVSFRSGRAISIRWVAPTRRTVAASARSWAGTC